MTDPPRNAIEAAKCAGGGDWLEQPASDRTEAFGGSQEKLQVMADRVQVGESSFHPEDSHQPLSTTEDVLRFVDRDLEVAVAPRRWLLLRPVVLRFNENQIRSAGQTFGELTVDAIEICGSGVALHAVETKEWVPIRAVLWSSTDEGPEILLLAVGGCNAVQICGGRERC